MTELDDAMLGVQASVSLIDQRLLRLEKAIVLLAYHVGATGWNKPLQDLLDEIEGRRPRPTIVNAPTEEALERSQGLMPSG